MKTTLNGREFIDFIGFDVWIYFTSNKIVYAGKETYFSTLWQAIEETVFLELSYEIALNDHYNKFKKIKKEDVLFKDVCESQLRRSLNDEKIKEIAKIGKLQLNQKEVRDEE